MEGWQGLLIGMTGPILVFLGVWLTYRSTKGRTQADHKSAQDKRLDDKMNAYTDRIESRLEKERGEREVKEAKVEELEAWRDLAEDDIQKLKRDALATARREAIVFQYITTLRNHVLLELPPPPPAVPGELREWFDNLEDTLPIMGGSPS